MAVKRRVRFRIEPYQRARLVEKGRKQGAENGLGAAWVKCKSASLRRVRPLKRPAVRRVCEAPLPQLRGRLREGMVNQGGTTEVSSSRPCAASGWQGRGFFIASVSGVCGLCRAAAVHL